MGGYGHGEGSDGSDGFDGFDGSRVQEFLEFGWVVRDYIFP